jgi:DNA-directed RNA polymerase I subunit RPA1
MSFGEDDEDDDDDDDDEEGGEEDGTLRVGQKLKDKMNYDDDDENDDDDSNSDDDDSDDDDKKKKSGIRMMFDDEAEEGSGSESDDTEDEDDYKNDDDEDDESRKKRKLKKKKQKEKQALKLKSKLSKSSSSSNSSSSSSLPPAIMLTSVKESNNNTAMIETKDGIIFNLLAPARAGRVLMVQLAEAVSELTVVKEMNGLTGAHVVEREVKVHSIGKKYDDYEKEKRWSLFTEGCNFHSIWQLEALIQYKTPNVKLFDLNRLRSNDVFAVLEVYGVEAARHNIVLEVRGVFDVYGIEVDGRHLSLIADTMTFGGGYRPFNRIGIGEATSSPFLQMSFETTAGFLTAAAVAGEPDRLTSPSARIVMGQTPKQGTGAFELRSCI